MGTALEEQSWVGRNIAQAKCLSLAHVTCFPSCRHSQNTAFARKRPMPPALLSSSHRWRELDVGILLGFGRR